MPQALAGALAIALFNAGAPMVVANAVLAFGATAISVGASLGLSLLSTALFAPKTASVKPSDGQQALRQPLPPRRKSYGRVKVSGAVWWYGTAPAEPDTLYYGLVLNHGRIGTFQSYHLDDARVTLDGSGGVTTAPYTGSSSDGYEEQVFIKSRTGLAAETAYSEIETAFGIADVRGDGVASLLAILDCYEGADTQIDVYPNGVPQVRVVMDSSVCFDPREA